MRTIREGLGDPVPDSPAARVAEGVLGPLPDPNVQIEEGIGRAS
jgi:hypothetical protein